MDKHRRKCLPDPDVTVMCITLQRKRRESASSSSSMKKVKKPWWGQEHQLVHGRGQGAVWVTVFTAEIPKVLGLDKKDTGEQDTIILSIYVEAPPTTHAHVHTHFSTTNETSPTPPHLLPTSLWQRQQLSDISFHYCSTPCLHHRWALDEARSTVNCQAELIGTWGRRWEWLHNWNELEWKTRLWEWDDLDFPRAHLTHLRFVL